MKVTYLELKNFSQIFTAMKRKTLKIDFSKCKNNIILLVGDNGSGKTTILSNLHPFAYPGSMDVRSGANMILKDESGYKEIHIDADGVLYVIKHHYTRNSSGSIVVKSYMSKDGEELNPNGNVTSFKELAYDELSIQEDYLKLIRLGSNVTNLIGMKSTERKNFSSELLSEIGLYTELYKKITEDGRVLKRLLNSVASKLTQTKVTDKESLKRDIAYVKENINLLMSDKEALQTEKGNIDGKLSIIIPEGLEAFRDKLKDLKRTYDDKQKQISSYLKQLKSIPVIITGNIDEYYMSKKDEYMSASSMLSSIQPTLDSLYNVLNNYYNDRDSIAKEMSQLTSDESYNDTEQVVFRLRAEVKSLESKYEKKKPVVTKDNVMTLINMMQEIDSMVSHIYEFGLGSVKYCISLINNGENVDKVIGDSIKEIDQKMVVVNSKFRNKMIPDDCIVLFRPSECGIDNCPYLSLYNRFFGKSDDTEDEDSIVSLQSQRDMLENASNIYTNIMYIRRLLQTNQNIISKLNMKQLSLGHIISRIDTMEPVYNEHIFTKIISDIEEYDQYKAKQDDLKNLEIKLGGMRGDTKLLNSLRDKENTLNDNINKVNTDIAKYKETQEKLSKRIEQLMGTIADLEQYMSIMKYIDGLSTESDDIYDDINANREKLENARQYIDKLSDITSKSAEYEARIKKMNDELFDKTYALKEYNNLIKEKDELTDKYDEIEIIKESLSSTKGIPLLFIQLYFKNIRIFVNKLLESVYDDFVVDDFEITTTDFNIPYIKNGVRINDVVHASQGESSFLSLALSFALINNSIKNYNILLLDEIDSTLDTRNRSMFLNILNQQIDMIDAEQVFLITHNNMFDSYPVDIILTSNVSLDNYSNANIIFSA